MVVSRDDFNLVKRHFREAGKPGHYFAPGCCHNPDHISQVPVVFEDETFDVMRAMNIKKRADLPEEILSAKDHVPTLSMPLRVAGR